MPNRLQFEQSPYLLQHRENPVDWRPWGSEAFQTAREEDKPIFLSIGYSACHWCHVMAHESFEDETVAEAINRDFIPIKVDREERPDVDAVYMAACVAMTGSGGWPLTVLLTPEQKPFWAGTYLPRQALLSLLLNSIYALDRLNKPPALVKAAFELRLLCVAGYEPLLDACALCGEEAPAQPRLDLGEGVLCCAACGEGEGASRPLDAVSLAAMRHVVYGDPKRLFSFSMNGESMALMARACEDFLLTQLDRGFRTLDFYKQLDMG